MENRNNNNNKSIFKTAIAWVSTVVFVLAGLGGMSISILSGLIMIVIGLILCPLTSKLLNEKMKLTLPRGIKTVLIIALFIAFGFSIPNGGNDTTVSETNLEDDNAIEKEGTQEVEKDEEEKLADKDAARDADSKMWDAILKSEEMNNNLLESANAYDEGNLSRESLYENCQIAKDFQAKVYSYFSKIDFENVKEYKNACSDYALYSKSFAENLQQYVNKGDLKKLTKAKDNLSYAQDTVAKIAIERTSFLNESGFTDEEVTEILEN